MKLSRVYTDVTLLQWGAKDTVHDVSFIATSCNAPVERQEAMVENNSQVEFAVRQFFRPYVLLFLSLAVAFAGWSYGYKLSQYLHTSEVTRASLTRAWPDQRNDSISVISHHQLQPVKRIGLQLFAPPALRIARRSPDEVLVSVAAVHEAFRFSSLLPFRAPPIADPSLA